MRHWKQLAAALALILPTGAATSASASADLDVRPGPDGDWEAPIVTPPGGLDAIGLNGVLDDDPLGLVPKLPFVQRYSLDTDHFEVWLCGDTGYTMNEAIADLETGMADYYDSISGGRYTISFSPGGATSEPHCINDLKSGALTLAGTPEGVLIIDSVTGGGYASPGIICLETGNCGWVGSTFPDNGRFAIVGADALRGFPSIAVHEIGHTLQWPHSNSGQAGSDDYDNPIDLMSGNNTLGGWTERKPYGSLAFNRYQSGWIEPEDVAIAGGGYEELTLQPHNVAGTQMIAVLTGTDGVFYTLGTRTTSTYDPIPSAWEGVEVYRIDHTCSSFSYPCPGIYRSQHQEPPDPDGIGHVLQPGESVTLESIPIEVIRREGTGFVVAIGDPSNTLPFIDISASAFAEDIVWLSGESITRGCNPPSNTRYCPSSTVTRGEMAAFLVRALDLTDTGGGNTFTDDDGSVFEPDIAKLAAAGITKGCNPPQNDRFCPDDRVTRQQMAAFLVRAYELTDDGGGNYFTDDNGSVFEPDIAKLAAAGITKGCNPPTNTEFCPYSAVTREQMAAFLHRASSG
ncbi:MAG: hypothetical protein GY722_11920 [bacterium]|nr:hypothetical protein [bacterium]